MELEQFFKVLYDKFPNIPKREINWVLKSVLKTDNLSIKTKITDKTQNEVLLKCEQLNNGKPLAYVINSASFFNCDFFVDENVLIPRFETELLVEKVVNFCKTLKNTPSILDLCSGSGCIAVSIAKALDTVVTAVEIDDNAIKIIKKNAEINKVNLNIIKSNLFEEINDKYDIIISNPPYIPTKEIGSLDNSVKDWEPKLALDGGIDGLDFYRKIAYLSPSYLNENGKLFLEIGFNQSEDVSWLLKNNFKDIEVFNDYSGLPRIVVATKRS